MSHGGDERRKLGFWGPFNQWWREEHDKLQRRPNGSEIADWYEAHGQDTWGDNMPSLEDTRVHAKCLRTVAAVRQYFAGYRERGGGKKRRASSNQEESEMCLGDMLDFQLGSMLRTTSSTAALEAPAFHVAQLGPALALSQLQHSAALQQQFTLSAIAQQLSALKQDQECEAKENTRPLDNSVSQENLSIFSRQELEDIVIDLKRQLEKKDKEVTELEDALARSNQTSTCDLRGAVAALKEMSEGKGGDVLERYLMTQRLVS